MLYKVEDPVLISCVYFLTISRDRDYDHSLDSPRRKTSCLLIQGQFLFINCASFRVCAYFYIVYLTSSVFRS